LATITSVTV
jgi:hypothetical protein